jgi:XapX domain-containing protein
MKIVIAFLVAFCIGAASRWTGVPSLAPQAIVGALLIVAMSTGYVSADQFLKRTPSPSAAVSVSMGAKDDQRANGQIADSSTVPIERSATGSLQPVPADQTARQGRRAER